MKGSWFFVYRFAARIDLLSDCLLRPLGAVGVVVMMALCCAAGDLAAQSSSASGAGAGQAGSLGEELRRADGREIHIFYIHGIGSDGPGAYDSRPLRKSICEYLRNCTAPAGESVGEWEYADQDEFDLGAAAPGLKYLGESVWKSTEEWHAAAPFVVHFRLARSNGPTVYVDELNWWPLVLALKCREILASDALLVGPSRDRIKTCSRREANEKVPQRFKAYDWITAGDAERLLALPSHSVLVNRALKNSILDWGFSDAIMALGPLHTYLVDGIRQLILKSMAGSAETSGEGLAGPAEKQEYVIVSHSLGSYLIFSALDIDPAALKTETDRRSEGAFLEVLRHTSLVYFFANQLPLLELAGLDRAPEEKFVAHLEAWGRIHCEYLQSLPSAAEGCVLPRIVALNDPNDLLTWRVPPLHTVDVHNYEVRNATRWFWIIENPVKAHDNYARDKRVIRQMLRPNHP